jgi:hypothetical protein
MQSSLTGNGTTHIYYNINITNNDTTGLSAPPIIDFNETRNQPYLGNPSEYFMSVVRFSVDTPTLPLFIPQPVIGGSNANQLIYSVTLEYKDVYAQVYLTFAPQTQAIAPPATPITQFDISNQYYYIYSYQWFVDVIVNPALISAYDQLKTLAIAKGYTLPSLFAPFMLWDPSSSSGILNLDTQGYDFATLDDPIKLYFNTPMYNLFSSFSASYFGFDGIVGGKNFLINSYNNGFNTFKSSTNGVIYIQVIQEYPTAPLWNPVSSLVFTTSLMPVVPELTAAPAIFSGGSGFSSSGNNSNLTNILTDLEVPLTHGWETKPTVNYVSSSEYRLTDLFGINPVSSINVTVFWKNRFGSLFPLTLASGGSANIKIMFRRKDYNNITLPDY